MLSLVQFMDKLDDMRFDKREKPMSVQAFQLIKKLKADYIEFVELTKKVYEQSLESLGRNLQYYESALQMDESPDMKDLDFSYF